MEKLKPKKVKGKITVLKIQEYKGSPVYIRQINNDIFEWLIVFKNEIYSSYLIITPQKDKNKLSKSDILNIVNMVLAGAETTIDTLLGVELSKEDKRKAELVESIELKNAKEKR